MRAAWSVCESLRGLMGMSRRVNDSLEDFNVPRLTVAETVPPHLQPDEPEDLSAYGPFDPPHHNGSGRRPCLFWGFLLYIYLSTDEMVSNEPKWA